ncbi:MAG: YdiU family protein, partial [Gammaproteobacteria bacterium]|nr:YdiU family protein [Gammaproteobacteria bacterium]
MKHALNKLPLTNTFAKLGETFFSRVKPEPFISQPEIVHFNTHVAELLDLDPDTDPQQLADILSGKLPLGKDDPIAMLYAGHQFGHYVPQLGDGRALMLGETTNTRGEKWEIQLKGSGKTPYSRMGDGRAVLRSTIREYLCSEAMHGLGIPTTRALCLIGSKDEVYREQIETGALLLRMSPSHVRFGSFEYMYYNQHFDELKQLADHVIEQHYANFKDHAEPYLALLNQVIKSTAELIAQWQSVGFAHGVMNTDNMSILGLTLDYGPYGFLDQYNRDFICNHSDYQSRYAFDKQPEIGLFNVSCLAQAVLPLLDDDSGSAVKKAQAELEKYQQYYVDSYSSLMRKKLGLHEDKKEDRYLCSELLDLMHDNQVDYTILFRQLSQVPDKEYENKLRDLFINREACDLWMQKYKQRIATENINAIER